MACTHLHVPARLCTDIQRYIHTYGRQTNRETNARSMFVLVTLDTHGGGLGRKPLLSRFVLLQGLVALAGPKNIPRSPERQQKQQQQQCLNLDTLVTRITWSPLSPLSPCHPYHLATVVTLSPRYPFQMSVWFPFLVSCLASFLSFLFGFPFVVSFVGFHVLLPCCFPLFDPCLVSFFSVLFCFPCWLPFCICSLVSFWFPLCGILCWFPCFVSVLFSVVRFLFGFLF